MGDRLATAGPAAHFGRNERHVIYGTGYWAELHRWSFGSRNAKWHQGTILSGDPALYVSDRLKRET
jgi:hypothetical protein